MQLSRILSFIALMTTSLWLQACDSIGQYGDMLPDMPELTHLLEEDPDAVPLFDNHITLLEKKGSRAFIDGMLARDRNAAAAKKAFLAASGDDIEPHIKARALREYAKLLRNQQDTLTPDAVLLLSQARDLGDEQAVLLLSDFYQQQGNMQQAVDLLLPLKDSVTGAKKRLALILHAYNMDTDTLFSESITEYNAMLDKKNPDAHIHLAQLHSVENTAFYDTTISAHHYREAAKHGSENALFPLADSYRTGNGLPKDTTKAIALYEQLATQGSRRAFNYLADAYGPQGWHQHNPQKHIAFVEQAANDGKRSAQLTMMNAYLDGYGVSPNADTARRWADSIISAEPDRRYGIAKKMLACNTEEATMLGHYYMQQAVDAGDEKAQHYLYTRHLRSLNSRQDVTRAVGILRKQPSLGTASLYFKIAEKYFGYNNHDTALTWLGKAANAGSPDAMKRYAKLHAIGLHTPQDATASLKWYLRAASLGDSEAQYYAGLAYARGLGTSLNNDKAAYWLSRASNGGRADAKAMLATLQQAGGTPQ